MFSLSSKQHERILYWWPALLGGFIAWLTFIVIGSTPLIRASGLALVIVGVTLTLRRLSAVIAITGGLALAYSPAFWSQTGGGESAGPATIVIALATAIVLVILLTWIAKRPYVGIALGLIVFTVIFWSQIGTPRSLRLTSFLSAWLLYLLITTLRLRNPRPDDPSPGKLDSRFPWGLLLLLIIGIINDPLFTLFAPAVIVALILANVHLPRWYWGIALVMVVFGMYRITAEYIQASWWLQPAATITGNVPYIIADGWREPVRWVGLFTLIYEQYTIVGVVLGVLGLSRMARWYPSLGVVTMLAFACYAGFGLLYFGRDRPVLLLPLLIIQMIWITYAVYTFGQWLQKSLPRQKAIIRWVAPALFTLLPIFMLLDILKIT